LPTEAEWEYAAKGGKKSSGYKYAGGKDPASIAWYNANSGKATHPAGGKQANELGLSDMAGNAWEWCWDWDNGAYAAGSQTDPRGADSGSSRVLRGGSWYDEPGSLHVSFRVSNAPDVRGSSVGFRVAVRAR
jgi:sulfatase modifying factor 1